MHGGVEIRSGDFLPGASEEGALHRGTEGCGEPRGAPDNIFCNEEGYVRLLFVQRALGFRTLEYDINDGNGILTRVRERKVDHKLTLEECDVITEQCTTWRNQRELIPMKYTFAADRYRDISKLDPLDIPFMKDPVVDSYGTTLFYDHMGQLCSSRGDTLHDYEYSHEHRFRVTPKRGNDVYCDLVAERFKEALEAPNVVFFDPAWGIKKTSMLYITVTTDPAVVDHDLGKAWLSFGKWWNSFITNLRQQFNSKISYVRTWQSQDNYSPHGHALVFFHNHDFTAVRWKDANGNISFRLPSRSHDRLAIKNAWKWGFCDIQCVADTQTAYKDLLKYVLRDLKDGACDKTNGMVWFFEKRSFAISGDYFDTLKGATSEPDVADLICAGLDNSNLQLVRIDVYPIVGADFVPSTWQNSLIKGDPPPDLVGFFYDLERRLQVREVIPDPKKCKRCRIPEGCRVFLWEKDKGGKF